MCEVLDRVEARGIEKGRLEGTINTLISLVKDGILSLDEAAIRADTVSYTHLTLPTKIYKIKI